MCKSIQHLLSLQFSRIFALTGIYRVRDDPHGDSRTWVREWGGAAPFVRTGVEKPLRTVYALGAQLRKGEVGEGYPRPGKLPAQHALLTEVP